MEKRLTELQTLGRPTTDPKAELTLLQETPTISPPTADIVEVEEANTPVLTTCPIPVDFKDVLVFLGEGRLPKVGSPLDQLIVRDTGMKFLREVMGETSEAITQEISNATDYFICRFGLDIRRFKPSQGLWLMGNHKFFSFYINPAINYRTYFTKDQGLVQSEIKQGGFVLVVGEPGFIARGSYGGDNGKMVTPGSLLIFGYYRIVQGTTPDDRIVHFRSEAPIKLDSDLTLANKSQAFHFGLKIWGNVDGSMTVKEEKDYYHFFLRDVLTFPGHSED